MAGRATCPECGRGQTTFPHRGRSLFVHHPAEANDHRGRSADPDRFAQPCPGSGWLVEDEDRVAS